MMPQITCQIEDQQTVTCSLTAMMGLPRPLFRSGEELATRVDKEKGNTIVVDASDVV